LRITCGTGDRLDLQVESHSVQNIFVDGRWKIALQEVSGNLHEQPWMMTQYVIDPFREPTTDFVFEQFTLLRVVVALPGDDVFSSLQFPDAVLLQSPERILGVIGLPWWTKCPQEPLERRINLSIRDIARFSTLALSQGVEQQ
jgi:hypothetical protein